MIRFTVLGMPIPKARARTTTLPNGRAHTYTPDRTRAWETSVRLQARRWRPKKPLDGPLMAELTFYLPKPPSVPRRVTYPATKPDLDNLAKSVFDALEGELFTNDSRIVDKFLRKRYGEPARVEIAIGPMEGGAGDGPSGEVAGHGHGQPHDRRRACLADREHPAMALAPGGRGRTARARTGAGGSRPPAKQPKAQVSGHDVPDVHRPDGGG